MCVEETALRLFGIAVAQLPDSDRAAAETSVDKIVPTLERRGELNVPLLKCTFESSIARDEFVVELESLGATRAFTDSLARCAGHRVAAAPIVRRFQSTKIRESIEWCRKQRGNVTCGEVFEFLLEETEYAAADIRQICGRSLRRRVNGRSVPSIASLAQRLAGDVSGSDLVLGASVATAGFCHYFVRARRQRHYVQRLWFVRDFASDSWATLL